MGKFSGYLYGSDIDGTLAYADGKVSEKNLSAIAEFEKEGGIFVVASGRFGDYAQTVLGYTPKAPVIALNGSMICDTVNNKVIWEKPLERPQKEAAADMYAKFADRTKTVCVNYDSSTSIPKSLEELENSLNCGKKPMKVVYIMKDSESSLQMCRYAKDKYSDKIRIVRSTETYVEVLCVGTGKEICLDVIKKMYPDVHTTVASGDYENDIEMLKYADIGYAVANAISEVKAAANRMAPACTEDAVAYIIDDMLK